MIDDTQHCFGSFSSVSILNVRKDRSKRQLCFYLQIVGTNSGRESLSTFFESISYAANLGFILRPSPSPSSFCPVDVPKYFHLDYSMQLLHGRPGPGNNGSDNRRIERNIVALNMFQQGCKMLELLLSVSGIVRLKPNLITARRKSSAQRREEYLGTQDK